MSTAKTISTLALIIFVSIAIFESYDIAKDHIKTSLEKNGIAYTATNGLLFGLGLESSTPEINVTDYHKENKIWKIGKDGEHNLFTEKIPAPGASDMLFLIPYWLLAVWITKRVWESSVPWYYSMIIILLLFTVGTILAYIIGKIIIFKLMIYGGGKIGLDETTVLQIREETMITARKNPAYEWFFWFGIGSFLATVFYWVTRDKNK